MKGNIELHIEELILHGFDHHNRYQIGEAVEKEITRLLQEGGFPANLSADIRIGRLQSDTIHLSSNAKTESIGNSIAGSVYKGIAE